MANFNTNQTRHLYVAKAVDSTHAIDSNDFAKGSIALKTCKDNPDGPVTKFYFSYKNADGLMTRSDLIDVKNVSSLKASLCVFDNGSVKSNPMDIPLIAHRVALDSNIIDLTSSSVVGKNLTLFITVHQALSYDDNDSLCFAAPVTISSAINTPALFHKELAKSVIMHTPGQLKGSFKVFSYDGTEITKKNYDSVSGNVNGFYIIPCSQSYVRGELANEPVNISVHTMFHLSNDADIQWAVLDPKTGLIPQAPSEIDGCKVIPAIYALADLEYFSLGERGDYNRGNWYHKEPKFGISDDDIESGANYNVLNIEYYWAGGAEDVQKSPRLLQVVAKASASNDIISGLYNSVSSLINA